MAKKFFAGFLSLFASILQRGRPALKGIVRNNQPRMRLGTNNSFRDPYPTHRHKSVAEKQRISKFLESRRRRVIAVGTNHDRVVEQRAQRQGMTAEEYKLKYQS